MFLSMGLELWLASLGICMPFTFLCVFYFTLVYGWRRTVYYSCAYSVLFELSLGRHFPFMLFVVFLVMGGASIWRRYGNLRSFYAQIVPGFCVGAVAALSNLLYIVYISVMQAGRLCNFSLSPLLMLMLSGALLFPVYSVFLDVFAYRLNYRRYRFAYNLDEGEQDG